MVKKFSFITPILILILTAGCSASGQESSLRQNAPNMKIDANGKITVTVTIDSLQLNMLLDTGGGDILFINDSAAASLGISTAGGKDIAITYGFDTEHSSGFRKSRLDTVLPVNIGGKILLYDKIVVDDVVSVYGMDGIIPIRSATQEIWKIDFDAGQLSVGAIPDMADADYIFNLKYDTNAGNYYIPDLNLAFVSGKDTLTYAGSFLIDTGSPYAISILGGGGMDSRDYDCLKRFLDEQAFGFEYWHQYPSGSALNSIFYAKECNLAMDTLKIMVRERSRFSANILGMDFLYRFNTLIDIPSLKIYFTRRKECASIDDSVLVQQNSLMSTYVSEGMHIITSINRNSWLYRAGLRRFDKIYDIDGYRSVGVSTSYLREKVEGDTVVFGIVRNGKRIKITAPK